MVFHSRISFASERTDPAYNAQEYPAASTAEDNISITSITYSVQIIVYLSKCMIGHRILETSRGIDDLPCMSLLSLSTINAPLVSS